MRGDHAGVVLNEGVLRLVAIGFGDPRARLVPASVHRGGPRQRVLGEDVVARLQFVFGDRIRSIGIEMMVGIVDREQAVGYMLLVPERPDRVNEIVGLLCAGHVAQRP